MNITKVMKMEQIDPVLVTAAAIIVLGQEVMVLQEPTAKVTTNPNKKYYLHNFLSKYYKMFKINNMIKVLVTFSFIQTFIL